MAHKLSPDFAAERLSLEKIIKRKMNRQIILGSISDFNFKTKNAKKFLEDGSKVQITVRFRGRELSYAKLGEQVLNKFVESLSEVSTLEKKPLLEGKNMFIILAPINK